MGVVLSDSIACCSQRHRGVAHVLRQRVFHPGAGEAGGGPLQREPDRAAVAVAAQISGHPAAGRGVLDAGDGGAAEGEVRRDRRVSVRAGGREALREPMVSGYPEG